MDFATLDLLDEDDDGFDDAPEEVDLELPLFSSEDREDLFATWRLDAACMGVPTDWFYGERGRGGVDNQGARAKAVCAECPVRAECLASALARNEHFGIWGGAGDARRRALARLARKGPEALAPALAAHWRDIDGCLEEGDVALLASYGQGATHGRRATQAKGCRCVPCVWSASVLGVVVARLGVKTAPFWERWAPMAAPGQSEREAVDEAARKLCADVVAGLFGLGWRSLSIEGAQVYLAEERVRRANAQRWSRSRPASGDDGDFGDRLAA